MYHIIYSNIRSGKERITVIVLSTILERFGGEMNSKNTIDSNLRWNYYRKNERGRCLHRPLLLFAYSCFLLRPGGAAAGSAGYAGALDVDD